MCYFKLIMVFEKIFLYLRKQNNESGEFLLETLQSGSYLKTEERKAKKEMDVNIRV